MVDVRAVYADGSSFNVAARCRSAAGAKAGADQRAQLRSARRGFQPGGQLSDQPGALGKIGTELGKADVNILAAQLSQDAGGESATIILRLDTDVPENVRVAIAEAVGATTLEVVDLS
ncbi:ACT domain-containing protein [Mycolicibacterium sarraceniae]|uniref:ACT domain-containing protein n=1 Tax=Mycolicibacterium sarraceniae TaxID=1534348 RepID=UPI003898E29B